MSVDHWMMFGTFAQKEYFEYPRAGIYKGVIINANMATHAPGALASFLLEKTATATYIIDPLTHAFQHDPDMLSGAKGGPKNSVMALAEAFGRPIIDHVGKRPVVPADFDDPEVLKDFVAGCVRFQCNQITSYMKESGAAKYLDPDSQSPPPYAVIAPYFFVTETTLDVWLPVNVKCAESALKHRCEATPRMFASVVISKGVLDDQASRKAVIDAYSKIKLDGFLVWVDELDELTASRTQLQAFVELCRGLRKNETREVVNLHGGYFSVLAAGLLGKSALTGVTHGPEFGEHRGVVPVGGGIPISRYYIPELHARIRYRDALRWFRANTWLDSAPSFHQNVCDCTVCRETLNGDADKFELFGRSNVKNVARRGGIVRIDFPTKEAQQRCLKHYLQRKLREYEAAGKSSKDVLLSNLRAGYDKYKLVAGLEAVAHLRTWHRIFAEANGESPF